MLRANRIGWAIFYSVCHIMVSLILLAGCFAFWPLAIIAIPIIYFGGVGAVGYWANALRPGVKW